MIVLDIAAPIFLMFGISIGSASNASLLGNFEIVATTLIALLIFKEKETPKLWLAVGFITLASIILSFEGSGSFQFSLGSLFVILDTMYKHHTHEHSHMIVHTHNGIIHTHVITHEHDHNHFASEDRHGHSHDDYINSEEHKSAHMNGK